MEILEQIEGLLKSEKYHREKNFELKEELRLYKKAIDCSGLTDHIEPIIKKIKEEEEKEIPF